MMDQLHIDFASKSLAYRLKHGGGRSQLIAKAVGIKSKENPLTVLDATAGLGVDAFILANLDCDVLMLERSPIIAALLKDALERASQNPNFKNIKLRLLEADSIDYLAKLASNKSAPKPDVIYIDPMYPIRTKSALGKKNLRILKDIVGEDLDAPKLLANALACARKRVVVKRPRLGATIAGKCEPDLVFKGKSSRYDVYLLQNK
jgi:16S rRNA (guanine1516-N2)-methyltransferase